MTLKHYDRQRREIDMEEWVRLVEDEDYKIVAKTTVGESWVSTVWLGIDSGFGLRDAPLIFETMIFPECDYCWRYPTEEAALAGHDQAVALAKDSL